MELRQLEYFVAVAERGSVTRGATALHVSQPAVSQALRALAEEMGQPLLRRTALGVEPTAAGRVVLRYALSILHRVDDLHRELGTRRDRESDVRVGVLPTLARNYVPSLLRRFLDEHGQRRVGLIELSTQALIQEVLAGEVHLGILDLPVTEPRLDVRPLWGERLILVAPKEWHLPEETVRLIELKDREFITLEPGYGLREAFYSLAQHAGFQPRVILELKTHNAILGYVEAGFGASVVAERVATLGMLGVGISAHQTEPSATRDIGIVWRRQGRPLPTTAEEFRDFLIETAEKVVHGLGDMA